MQQRETPPVKASALIVLATVVAFVGSFYPPFARAQANIVENGGFELPKAPDGGAINLAGGTTILGWEIGGESIDIHDTNHTTAREGLQSIDLAGFDLPGSITQTLSTEPGVRYHLDFYYAGHAHGSHPKRFDVVFGAITQQFDINASESPDAINWTYSGIVELTAASNETVLSFESLVHNGGPLVDDVRVRVAEAAGSGPCAIGSYNDSSKYHEIFLPSCHNCYEPERAPSLFAALDGGRA